MHLITVEKVAGLSLWVKASTTMRLKGSLGRVLVDGAVRG